MILHAPFFLGKTTGAAILNDLRPFFHPDYMCRLFHEKILLRYDEMIISQNSVFNAVHMVYRLLMYSIILQLYYKQCPHLSFSFA